MKILRVVIPCLLLQACLFGTSKNAKFYTLSAVPVQPVSADYTAVVGVNRIQFPKYVDRPQMVTQHKNSAHVNISEFNRWVESPSILATRVLTDNLAALLPAAQINETRLKKGGINQTVTVEIVQINAVLGEEAGLVAWCTIKGNAGKVQSHQKFEYTVAVGKSYDELAQAYNRLIANLSKDIAAVLAK